MDVRGCTVLNDHLYTINSSLNQLFKYPIEFTDRDSLSDLTLGTPERFNLEGSNPRGISTNGKDIFVVAINRVLRQYSADGVYIRSPYSVPSNIDGLSGPPQPQGIYVSELGDWGGLSLSSRATAGSIIEKEEEQNVGVRPDAEEKFIIDQTHKESLGIKPESESARLIEQEPEQPNTPLSLIHI